MSKNRFLQSPKYTKKYSFKYNGYGSVINIAQNFRHGSVINIAQNFRHVRNKHINLCSRDT